MFGYIRPDAPELRVREFERFRACYCGLCHELGREYGAAARLILNYDFVFLTMLIWRGESSEYCMRRCLPSLFRRRCVCASSDALSEAAAESVILTYWKLTDTVSDEKGIKRLAARLMRAALSGARKKAAQRCPDFENAVRERLAELAEIERSDSVSLDMPADKFALLLSSAASGEETFRRPLAELLYHVGRIIYIADAYSDLEEDHRSGAYNPVARRFGVTSGKAAADVSGAVLETLLASQSLAAAAFELLPENYWTPVTRNIIYLGIPDMCRRVVAGTYVGNMRKYQRLPKSPDKLPEGTES